jgi:hypothetical protein
MDNRNKNNTQDQNKSKGLLFYKNGNDRYSTEGIRVEFNDGTTFVAQIDSKLVDLSAKIIRKVRIF